jgi:hypothetical protein
MNLQGIRALNSVQARLSPIRPEPSVVIRSLKFPSL